MIILGFISFSITMRHTQPPRNKKNLKKIFSTKPIEQMVSKGCHQGLEAG